MPSCHSDINILCKEYVEIQTRRKKAILSIRPCNDELVVNTNEGWISIERSLKGLPILYDFPATHSNLEILNLHDHGIYTKFKVELYIKNKEREGYCESILNKLILGVCINEGYYNQENNGIPICNSRKLEELDLNPFETNNQGIWF